MFCFLQIIPSLTYCRIRSCALSLFGFRLYGIGRKILETMDEFLKFMCENIDVGFAENLGIRCFNAPEGNRDAVGEHTLGMLLMLMNKFLKADREVRKGIWLREENRGLEIKGKTIGIIGYGNMGQAFAQRLSGFEANVITFDKYKTGYSDEFVKETDMVEIFSKCDILSMHIPLTEETTFLLNDEYFNNFKKNGRITYLPDKKEEIKKSRFLLKPLLIDLSLAFIVVSIISAAYMIAGAILMGPPHNKLPTDTKLVQNQLVIFTYLADWLKPIFQVGVFFALFGTVYAGFEAATRMLYETSKTLSKKVSNIDYKKFMLYVLEFILITSIPLALKMYLDPNFSVLLLLSITLMFIGVIGVIVYGIGVVYLSQTVLPEKYKLSKTGLLIGIIGIFFMCIPLFFIFI